MSNVYRYSAAAQDKITSSTAVFGTKAEIMHYNIQRQLTVALENQPGKLAAICQMMADHQINIQAISVIDSIEQGVVRIVTSDPPRCLALLRSLEMYVIEADVLALELTDNVGRLALIAQKLSEVGLNIDYLYGSSDQPGVPARIILKVADLGRASQILDALPVE